MCEVFPARGKKVVCSNQLGLKEEEENNRQALFRCNYPLWALNRLQSKIKLKFSTKQQYQQQHHLIGGTLYQGTYLMV